MTKADEARQAKTLINEILSEAFRAGLINYSRCIAAERELANLKEADGLLTELLANRISDHEVYTTTSDEYYLGV